LNRAQGTIEYLVIIGVVVVISLVVASLLVGFMSSAQNVSSKSSKINAILGNIAIIEAVMSEDGNYFITLKNNSGDNLTISKIEVGDKVAEPNKSVSLNGEESFIITSSMVCEEGQLISSEIKITYLTSQGLTKSQDYSLPISFECSNFTPIIDYVDEYGDLHDPNEVDLDCDETMYFCNGGCVEREPGLGTSQDPYRIYDCLDLNAARGNFGIYDYELAQDIDCSDTQNWDCVGEVCNGFSPLGDLASGRVFNGKGHKISNLYINNPGGDTGLFSRINGTVKNLGLENIHVQTRNTGTAGYSYSTGPFAAGIYGLLENSYVIGTVVGNGAPVGGISGFGYHHSAGFFIKNSYSVISFEGTWGGGGGSGSGINGFATFLSGGCDWTQYGGKFQNSYYQQDQSLNILQYLNCFPTVYTNQFARSNSDLKNQSNFVGWDFDTNWAIDPNINNGYPYLRALDNCS